MTPGIRRAACRHLSAVPLQISVHLQLSLNVEALCWRGSMCMHTLNSITSRMARSFMGRFANARPTVKPDVDAPRIHIC